MQNKSADPVAVALQVPLQRFTNGLLVCRVFTPHHRARAAKVQNYLLNIEIGPKLQTLPLCSTPALSRRLALRLAYSSRRQTVPVWPPCNLPDTSLCARTHLSLWPRGSRCQQTPRMFESVAASARVRALARWLVCR